MIRYFRNSIFLSLVLFSACAGGSKQKQAGTENFSQARIEMEAQAQQLLAEARRQLEASQCQAARKTIQRLRKDCYLALSARREAILLMDSIDLHQARLDLSLTDSLMRAGNDTIGKEEFDEACRKVQFYERKIQFDKQKNNASN